MIKFECPRVIHHLISFTFDVIYVAALFPACCEKGPMDLSLMLFSVLIFAMDFFPQIPGYLSKKGIFTQAKIFQIYPQVWQFHVGPNKPY